MLKKTILLGMIALASSSFASENVSDAQLKTAIAKLIENKADKFYVDAIKADVEKNTRAIKQIKQTIETIQSSTVVTNVTNVTNMENSSKVPFINGKVSNCHTLHLRKSSGIKSPIRGYLKRGDFVKIIDGDKNGWLNVVTPKGSGWVSGKYISKR